MTSLMLRALTGAFLLLVVRKQLLGFIALYSAHQCADVISIESLTSDPKLAEIVDHFRSIDQPPAVLFFNKFALNMTANWLCNTAVMPGVHSRALLVTLDAESRDFVAQLWPNLRQFYRPVSCLKVTALFSYLYTHKYRKHISLGICDSHKHTNIMPLYCLFLTPFYSFTHLLIYSRTWAGNRDEMEFNSEIVISGLIMPLARNRPPQRARITMGIYASFLKVLMNRRSFSLYCFIDHKNIFYKHKGTLLLLSKEIKLYKISQTISTNHSSSFLLR